ncbi:GNAT family N-acetyltransferase [Streptomyces sp. NBC_00239]|uniref:GNAT family N-acetyltransferase n=1 Tax=Streptomyces sp. NBC_00239 TaxID=2903640 RepID=UPI002E295266|nr:GNAT family N-acetyltransferase [Streptomyces sp. NBC_00239]
MLFRSTTAEELDRVATYPAHGPVPAIAEVRCREEFAARQYRPEWTWVAEAEDGEILARALWWGREDAEHPIALDCLHVRDAVADPVRVAAGLLTAAHAAFRAAGAKKLPLYNILALPGDWREQPLIVEGVTWRQEAARAAGLTQENERLRLEWTPESPLPPAPTRLVFSEAGDDAFLDVFARIAQGSLDVNTQRELAEMGVAEQAREDLRFYLDCPGERSWWRLAHLPDGTLAGLALPSRTPYHRNVGYLGVVPELRGQGLIDEILAEITRFHAAEGADRITATTDTVNVPMAAAFRRAGYQVPEVRLIMEPEPEPTAV